MSSENHALVFGATGISGWALCNQLLRYPTPTTFARIVGLHYRELSLADSGLPTDDPRLNLVSGLDLRGTLDSVKAFLHAHVRDLGQITHVYYVAYAYSADAAEHSAINTTMLENAASAVSQECPRLQKFMLQTGVKFYGIVHHAQHALSAVPFRESAPLLPEPYASVIFYYAQAAALARIHAAAATPAWAYFEAIPDVIVGFVPAGNVMNLAQTLALYLATVRFWRGRGASAAFPGGRAAWTARHVDTAQDLMARAEIALSLMPPATVGAERFNVASQTAPTSWCEKWPRLAEWFGLVGVGPGEEGEEGGGLEAQAAGGALCGGERWWEEQYGGMVRALGLRERDGVEAAWGFVELCTDGIAFDRHLDLTKIRALGIEEEVKAEDAFFVAWERLRDWRVLPRESEFPER